MNCVLLERLTAEQNKGFDELSICNLQQHMIQTYYMSDAVQRSDLMCSIYFFAGSTGSLHFRSEEGKNENHG